MSSTDSNIKIPYQKVEDYQSEVLGFNISTNTYLDKFNNIFDIVKANLSYGEVITIRYHYKIELNDIRLNTDYHLDSGDYNTSDQIHELYCNSNDPFYQGGYPELINLSNYIVGDTINPVEKAKKICTWISNNIEYGRRNRTNVWLPNGTFGALETYQLKKWGLLGFC